MDLPQGAVHLIAGIMPLHYRARLFKDCGKGFYLPFLIKGKWKWVGSARLFAYCCHQLHLSTCQALPYHGIAMTV